MVSVASRSGAFCLLVLCLSKAQAGAFQLFGFGVNGDATATSNHVNTGDASIAYWNPAGTVWLNPPGGTEITAFGQLLSATQTTDITTANAVVPPPAGTPVDGQSRGTAESLNLIPNVFVTRSLGKHYALGLALTSPFGLPTKYDDDWKGRYFAIESQLITIDLNPSFSLELSPNFAIGVGLDLLYARAKLSNAVDLSSACLAQAAVIPALAPACAASGFVTPGSTTTDGKVELKGDDLAVGWNAAAMFRSTDGNTRVGLSFRSRYELDLAGDADFSLPGSLPAPLAAAPALTDTRFHSQLTLPATASLAVSHKFTGAFEVFGSVTWTDWSELEELRASFANDSPDNVTRLEWEDSYRYAAGLRLSPPGTRWSISSGVAYDESPVTPALRHPRVPDAGKIIIGIGAGYEIDNHSSVDIAYSRTQIADTDIHLQSATAGSLVGDVHDAHLDVIGAQYSYKY